MDKTLHLEGKKQLETAVVVYKQWASK